MQKIIVTQVREKPTTVPVFEEILIPPDNIETTPPLLIHEGESLFIKKGTGTASLHFGTHYGKRMLSVLMILMPVCTWKLPEEMMMPEHASRVIK